MPTGPPLTDTIRAFLDLLIPPCCALCSLEGSVLCGACLGRLAIEPRRVAREGLPGLVGFAATRYQEAERELLVAFKERGQHALARLMAAQMALAFGEELSRETSARVLVPIPSAASACRARGFTPAHLIAKHLTRELSPWASFRVSDMLRRTGSGRDQSTLGREERFANLQLSVISVSDSGSGLAPSCLDWGVILVDDLVTTGASMQTAARVLQNAGVCTQTFCSFAETLLRSEI